MQHPIDIAVNGACGRMGQAVLRIAAACADVRILAALVRRIPSAAPPIGSLVADGNAQHPHFTTTLDEILHADALIDFSGADGFDAALALACERRMAFVCGSTGLSARQQAALDQAAQDIPLLWSANFSLGIAALTRAVADAARRLPDWDCEIIETHHRDKRDAPSGTALALGRTIASARGQDFDAVARFSRVGVAAARSAGEIGFAVVRGGDVAGEHAVQFLGAGERIELTHRATSRDIFARGALAAAVWLAGRPAGRYTLEQVAVRP